MGNRAVIAYESAPTIGIYLHWNGGPESILAFLGAARKFGARSPGSDPAYSFARLIHVITTFFNNDGLCVGVGPIESLDADNFDNGLYWIGSDWNISKREYCRDRGAMCVEDLTPGELKKYEAIEQELLLRMLAPIAAAKLLAESEETESIDTGAAVEILESIAAPRY